MKQIEVLKYFDLSKENPSLNNYIKNFYLRMKLSSETEFENYLKKNDLTLTFIKQKIEIELSWNQLIYDRYKNQINIDTEKLKKKINLTSSQLNERVYLLSEIVFENSKEISFEQKVQNINESIKKIGFKNTANIYSTSDSAKFGGNIGWVEEKKLSKKILDVIKPLNINEHTLPIQIGGAFLILKKKELKVQKKIINKAEELDKRIQYESTKQLDRFSKIYYNKIKINTSINEL